MEPTQRSPIPRYTRHKTVGAFKILRIEQAEDGDSILFGLEWMARVAPSYVARHDPKVGGYYVEYEDGYQSWSPPAAFERGYTKITETPP